jgi:DNA helicase-2/ATP-dependent DNA helicase PcrA
MFIWNPTDLNKEQQDAIIEPGNVLLIACPGSGKTRTLTYKIAYELERQKESKKFVIAITYTNNAAEEIKDRIELLGVDTSQLWIGTIHSFCTEWILRPYASYLDVLKFGFRVINSHESELLLNTFCAGYPSQRLSSYDCNHVFNADGYVLTSASQTKRVYVERVLDEYWKYLDDNREIDFELILYYSYLLLRDNDFISKTLSNIFSHILIDEFQDTKELQYLILAKIISRNKTGIQVLVVGDPNQSIYGTLGGYAIAKNELEKITGVEFIPYELFENYRSSIKIIEYFDNFKTFPNKIVGSGINKDYDSIISFNNTIIREDLEQEIVRLILHSINELNISPNEICVLAPQWAQLAGLTRNLMVKMPDYSFNGPGMAPFSRDIAELFSQNLPPVYI